MEVTQMVTDGNTTKMMVEAHIRQKVGELATYVEVSIKDGTVTLDGAVESWDERDAVLQAAQNTPGVQQVVNHLHLRGYRVAW